MTVWPHPAILLYPAKKNIENFPRLSYHYSGMVQKISFKRNRGITYIEVVLAIAIVAFIVMAFARMFLAHNVAVTSSTKHTLAGNWASDRMEEIKSTYYASVTTTTFSAESRALDGINLFASDVNIVELEEGLKEVEVIVSWEDAVGEKSLRIVSFVADY